MDGLLVIDKPIGPTSHDVVARARHALGERRIGHTGTLDPLASGVLPLVIGRATRLARFLSASSKRYHATLCLGVTTDSGDAAGQPVGEPYGDSLPDAETIDRALNAFRGSFLQQPPRFSAKKIQGVPSHRLARRQIADAPLPQPVEVSTQLITLLSAKGSVVELDVHCSAGFYVRALAHDLGQRLGTGAHLAALRRTASGALSLPDAIPLTELEESDGRERAGRALIPLSKMLQELPAVTLTDDGLRRVSHGQMVAIEHRTGQSVASASHVRLLSPSGELVAMATPLECSEVLHPAVVLM